MKLTRFASILAAAALLVGCSTETTSDSADSTTAAGDDTFDVYATTGYLADAVSNIAPDANVITMVGPGGDPHTYQPSTQDIETMDDADAIFWNGLHLEAQMIDQLESYGDKQLAVADQLDEADLLPWEDDLYDPHVWNDPLLWQEVVTMVAEKLGELDPDNAQEYLDNAEVYNAEIAEVHEDVSGDLEAVAEPRILITGHDAFNYFGRTYDLDVYATDFISTEATLSATELSELADLIVDNQVPTIFLDNQANPQAITSLQEAVESRGWTVEISDEELFADSLGPTAPQDTYLGVLRHNATVVVDGLA